MCLTYIGDYQCSILLTMQSGILIAIISLISMITIISSKACIIGPYFHGPTLHAGEPYFHGPYFHGPTLHAGEPSVND